MHPKDKAVQVLKTVSLNTAGMVSMLAREHPQIFLKLADEFKTGETPRKITEFDETEIIALIKDDKYVHAIKMARQITGVDLRTAKHYVDSLRASL